MFKIKSSFNIQSVVLLNFLTSFFFYQQQEYNSEQASKVHHNHNSGDDTVQEISIFGEDELFLQKQLLRVDAGAKYNKKLAWYFRADFADEKAFARGRLTELQPAFVQPLLYYSYRRTNYSYTWFGTLLREAE